MVATSDAAWRFLELVLQMVQVIGLAIIAAWVRSGVVQRQPTAAPEVPPPDIVPASPDAASGPPAAPPASGA
jgi:hypothetical protein